MNWDLFDRCLETDKVCLSHRKASEIARVGRASHIKRKHPTRCYFCKACGCWHLTSQDRHDDIY